MSISIRPRIFIGSSSEGADVTGEFQTALDRVAQPKLWHSNVFEAGGTTLQSLLREAAETSFALLVLTGEDLTTSRGKPTASPRDNVVFEMGLFLGRLGAGRVFFAYEEGLDIKIPSDLHGVTPVTWRPRDDNDLLNAIGPAAREISKVIQKLGPLEAPATAPAGVDVVRRAIDGMDAIVNGAAGVHPVLYDELHAKRWTGNVVSMALDAFRDRAADVYAAWLRPTDDPDELSVYQDRNLSDDDSHHPFRRGEGLAGKVWTTGRGAATSSLQQHEWWEPREGCENQSYICTNVGPPGGPGGVLAIGSDSGFEVADGDLTMLSVFAAMLAMVVGARPRHHEGLLRRVEIIERDLQRASSGEPAPSWSVAMYNVVLRQAQATLTDDQILADMPAADESFTAVGVQHLAAQLRVSLDARA